MREQRVTDHCSPVTAHRSAGQLVSCQLLSPRGFTFLELVIAFTILGLMSGIIFSSFRLAMNSYVKSQTLLDEKAQERVLVDQIKRQIGSLYPARPTSLLSQTRTFEPQRRKPRSAVAASELPLFYGVSDSVTFITVAPLMFQENPGLTVVRYGWSEDERGNLYLGAMESPFTGFDSFSQMVEIPDGKPLPLIKDVLELQFEYYGYDPQLQEYQWYDFWSGEEMRSVPSAIRIRYDSQYLLVPVNADFQSGSGGQRVVRRR